MKKAELLEIEALYETIVDLFDRQCGICLESYDWKNKKGKRPAFVLHHREYPPEWKKWTDFMIIPEDGKPYPDKLNYLRYLIPLIHQLSKEEANKIFMLMHHRHHYAAEVMARTRQPKLNRVLNLILEINRMKYPSDYHV